MFTLVWADMAEILFKSLAGLEAEEEGACSLFLRRQPNTRAHSLYTCFVQGSVCDLAIGHIPGPWLARPGPLRLHSLA
jgi:hypothetical protein